ncbi:hypothetical protein JQX13_45255 [Archangium violaceum]|uniref:hypothetical protein n=1 Tax=Archangium violaceum TaxID=83451 RepID=UPI00193C4DEC|nr:hypothetical protein [Archangium violaceum]QRK07183.1 hypothetical protein JQX13_45255 [Archangium violaceum]
MGTNTSLNMSLIVRLREMAATGHGVCEMVRWLLENLSLDASNGRIMTIAYLSQAFHLSAGDASAAGAWNIFPGGTWSDEECEQFLLPRIRATRNQWM